MEKPNYNVSVNGQDVLKNATQTDLDFIRLDDNNYHILYGERSFMATLEKVDYFRKSFVFNINGGIYEVKVADQFDQTVDRLGLTTHASTKFKDVKAPMPGLVLEVMVEPGQKIEKGDTLLILEAMKMENVLKSPGDGVVKKVKVEKGAAVNKNQILLEME
ncbi:MAG TPA: acetyl-CoA carboxylase biotin carboxyl carrier protein subunit [Haliscomenobacter sp.]|uniref:acetyl-CoA carboxylase biotin carboxyl carrier protein subunit n=1 Tax=Haliscomenobacter sp. TaxID=2717303 RepID=UPI002BD42486|nr:acetyl-CoA carboxylase biotin carboxyl carrier protein subunit [Haliscomenobacter sp.]HOY16153.1 acetyl-CoA carboxylase biotin carboxyl carrier protein subunit [Haliscomenobacter sp.]